MQISLSPPRIHSGRFLPLMMLLTLGTLASRAQYLDYAGDNLNFMTDATADLSCFANDFDVAAAFTNSLFGHQMGVWTFSEAECELRDCCWPIGLIGDDICRGYAHAGGSVYVDGMQTQEVRIKYFMMGFNHAKDSPNGYWVDGNANLNFGVSLIVQGAPPGFPLDLYASWRHFGGLGGIDGGDAGLTNASLVVGQWGEVLTTRFDFNGQVIQGFNRQRGDLPAVTVFNGDVITITFVGNGNSSAGVPNPGDECFNYDMSNFCQTGEVVIKIGAQPVLSEPDSLIPGANYIEFSLDIGSDAELSDPNADGDERFDPGDAYISSQTPLPTCGADGTRDDQLYQAFDCFPNTPDCAVPAFTRAPVGSGFPIDSVQFSFGDMDGLDNLDVQLEQFQYGPGFPAIGYFLSTCVTHAEYLYISYEDDSPRLFTDSLPPSVPVNSQSSFNPQTYSTEIFGLAMWGLGTYPKTPAVVWNYLSESKLHVNLAPDPTAGEAADDDVDAIDIRDNTCSEWYFSVDHEAGGCVAGLNPGAIYRASNAGPVLIADPQIHLGLPFGTDVQDFEFAWMDDFLPPNAFTSLALFFTVDEDDPATPVNESGWLDPNMIYWSLLNGLPPMPVLATSAENPIDGLAAWAVPLMTANVNPNCTRDYDLALSNLVAYHYGVLDFNDDCPLSPLPDHISRVTIPYAGEWMFNMCRTQYNYDFRLYLMESCCGGNQLAFNEDFCGALPSLCVYLQPGEYYLIIEGPGGAPYQLGYGPCGPSSANCGGYFENPEQIDFSHFNGGDPNGGCDLAYQGYPPTFSHAFCGGTQCGSLFRLTDVNGVSHLDTDWWYIPSVGPNRYQICTMGDVDLHLTLYEFPFGPCIGNTIVINYGHYGANQEVCATDSSMGGFYLRVAPVFATQLQDSLLYDYQVFVECMVLPCLPAQNLVITPLTGVPNAFQLRFYAPQTGIYTVYKTINPNQVGPPPAAGWTSIVDYTVVTPGNVDIYLNGQLEPYAVYSVIHTCQ